MAETEYTRRDIESVAEKEWGRIDIVEAGGGGGSGDFSTCNVTVQRVGSGTVNLAIPRVEGEQIAFLSSLTEISNEEPKELEVVLYKGVAIASLMSEASVSTTGSITYDDVAKKLVIQGDGTITFTVEQE